MKARSETRIKQMAAVAAAGIGAVSLGAANLPQPVSAATNDVQASSSQDDLKTAQENVKTAEAENTQAQQAASQAQSAVADQESAVNEAQKANEAAQAYLTAAQDAQVEAAKNAEANKATQAADQANLDQAKEAQTKAGQALQDARNNSAAASQAASEQEKEVSQKEETAKQAKEQAASAAQAQETAKSQAGQKSVAKDQADADLKNAQENLAKATDQANSAKTVVAKNEQDLQSASDEASTAKKANDDAVKAQETAKAAAEEAQSAADQAQTVYDSAKANADQKTAGQEAAQKAYDDAQVAKTTAEAEKTAAANDEANAKSAVDTEVATKVLYSGELPGLENKVKTAQAAYNYHKRETETRQNTFENTYQKAVTDAEANVQATKTAEGDVNKIVLPDGFLEAAQEYYVADENSKAAAAQKLYEVGQKGLPGFTYNNRYISAAADEGRKVEFVDGQVMNADDAKELTLYAASLINPLREANGRKAYKVSQNSVQYSSDVAKEYDADQWRLGARGHDVLALNRVAMDYSSRGISSNSETENATNGFVWLNYTQDEKAQNLAEYTAVRNAVQNGQAYTGTIGMNKLKQAIYESILGCLVDDSGSNWGHMKAFLFANPLRTEYLGVSIDHFLQIHFNSVSFTNDPSTEYEVPALGTGDR